MASLKSERAIFVGLVKGLFADDLPVSGRTQRLLYFVTSHSNGSNAKVGSGSRTLGDEWPLTGSEISLTAFRR